MECMDFGRHWICSPSSEGANHSREGFNDERKMAVTGGHDLRPAGRALSGFVMPIGLSLSPSETESPGLERNRGNHR